MTRRTAVRYLAAIAGLGRLAVRLPAQSQSRPDSFKVYTESPRLLLRPARLKLLRRERERRSLRWDQFETLWTAGAPFPEAGAAQALRYRLADDKDAGTRAVAWAVGPGGANESEVRQIALIADWCAPIISKEDMGLIAGKLRREIADLKQIKTLADARTKIFAAVVLSEAEPAASERAIQAILDGFWNTNLIPALRSARESIPNPDAFALLEIMHAIRDNLNYDLRETFPKWFEQYPVLHLIAHYPAPWPGSDNEFRIAADETIETRGPDTRKATLSRAAELAMVAYDANTASSQLLQGWLMNDRFLMRGTEGIVHELLWANPYQPGLSYQHISLALHDEIGGQLYVRSSWDDDAAWAGYFRGQLQLFQNGAVTRIDPRLAREPLDLDSAVVLFARNSKRFTTPSIKQSDDNRDAASVFLVGLDAGQAYHLEVDGEEMVEEKADPGGIVFLPQVPGGAGVRLSPRTLT